MNSGRSVSLMPPSATRASHASSPPILASLPFPSIAFVVCKDRSIAWQSCRTITSCGHKRQTLVECGQASACPPVLSTVQAVSVDVHGSKAGGGADGRFHAERFIFLLHASRLRNESPARSSTHVIIVSALHACRGTTAGHKHTENDDGMNERVAYHSNSNT